MKALVIRFVWLGLAWCSTEALGDSYDMPLAKKVRTLPVVAEVRINRIEVRPDPPNKFEDLLCDCEVLQAFKLPFATNRLTLRMNFSASAAKYEGKKVIVFGSESTYGHFTPYGAKKGFILEGEAYHDRYSRTNIGYTELIRQVKAILEANQQVQANGRWPAVERPSSALRRFDACPGSKMTVRGTSGIHEWRAEGGLISGFLEVPADFPSAPTGAPKEPKIEARGEVFIPVRNLKAAGKTWEPDNEQITVAMHRMLRAQEHPKILFRLTEPLAPMRRASTATTYAFEATGDLVIAGTTNRISMPLEVAPLTTNKLKLSGSAKLKQSDFKVIPKPKPVLDSWDNDSVEIAFEWMVEQKQDHEALHGSRSN